MRDIKTRAVSRVVSSESHIESATCDRCGEPALCLNASAEKGWPDRGPWAVARVLRQGRGFTPTVFDLCRECGEDLVAWVGRDDGSEA